MTAALLAAVATQVCAVLVLTGAAIQKSGVVLSSLLVSLVDEVSLLLLLLLLLFHFQTVFHLSQWRILHCGQEQ